MEIKNRELFEAVEPLKKLMSNALPVQVSYKLVKLVNKLNTPFKDIEDTVTRLRNMYGEKDENGRLKTVVNEGGIAVLDLKPENADKLNNDFEELMEHSVEVVIEKVKLPETLEIEPNVLMALEKFVEV